MTEKAPRPFVSGVNDFDALHKRLKELGIRSIVGEENGVDVTPKPAPPVADPGHYDGMGCLHNWDPVTQRCWRCNIFSMTMRSAGIRG